MALCGIWNIAGRGTIESGSLGESGKPFGEDFALWGTPEDRPGLKTTRLCRWGEFPSTPGSAHMHWVLGIHTDTDRRGSIG